MTTRLVEKNHLSAKGLLRDFKREHPHLPVVVVEEALSSNGPHLMLLKELNMGFIAVVKSEGNKSLFDWVESFDWGKDVSKRDFSQGEFLFVDAQERTQKVST